jgi:Ca2+-binding EF-hand superfamily protein
MCLFEALIVERDIERMDTITEFDIRDSFDAMDQERRGRISMDAFKVVYMGLGFPRSGNEDLAKQVMKIQGSIDDGLSFTTVMAMLSKVCEIREWVFIFRNAIVFGRYSRLPPSVL